MNLKGDNSGREVVFSAKHFHKHNFVNFITHADDTGRQTNSTRIFRRSFPRVPVLFCRPCLISEDISINLFELSLIERLISHKIKNPFDHFFIFHDNRFIA